MVEFDYNSTVKRECMNAEVDGKNHKKIAESPGNLKINTWK